MKRRAVITGIGAVTPIGLGREEFWKSLVSGRSGIRPITRFDAGPFPVKMAGEVQDFETKRYMDARDARRLPLFAQYATAAARMAAEDAGLNISSGRRIGSCFASSIGGVNELLTNEVPAFEKHGPAGLDPRTPSTFGTHTATSAVCQVLGLDGPKASISSGCTSGMDVVAWGRQQIELGTADAVIVGCSDTSLIPFTFGVLCATHGISPDMPSPRPFDYRHNGSAISEAAGAVVIESMESARQRSAPIYAEILGYGSAGEQGDFFRMPAGDAGETAIRRALRDAGLAAEDVDAVFPLAPGLPPLDVADAKAIIAALGEHAYHIPCPAIQSMLGHPLSAASMMQVLAGSLALKYQEAPPTINYERADPECALDCVPGRSRPSRLRRLLVFSRSLSRTCTVLALGAPIHDTATMAQFTGRGRLPAQNLRGQNALTLR
ncbi:MAG TPA: beta-ketoacyl-[acyl-carrier-protein] synthase family protein [Armatimonadota bacterium]|nr:beta-ketoacyl-[acyl-carrier-protein] synthase family protein [Armatimonadota bacterium]